MLMPIGAIAATGCTAGPATLAINESERHQTIDGWEVTARAWEFDKTNDRFDGSVVGQKERLAQVLADDIGIDRMRLEIKSGMENPIDYWSLFASGQISYGAYRRHFYDKINDNADPGKLNAAGVHFSDLDWHVETFVIPLKRKVEARGRRLRLNLAYVDFKWTDVKGDLSHAKAPAEYAELVTATFQHLQDKYGLRPDSLEIVIEPDNTDDWDGTAIGRVIVATGDRLDRAGFRNVELIAPSTAKGQRALGYFREIRTVPGAAERLSTVSYHRYEGEPDTSDLRALSSAASKAGKRTAMLEYVDADITDLLADLVSGQATSWQQYGIATWVADGRQPKPGWLVLADGQSAPKLAPSAIAQTLSLVFRNVDSGSMRVGADSSSNSLPAVAFITPRQKLVVVLHATAVMPLTINGLRTGRYRVSGVDTDGRTIISRSVDVRGSLKFDTVRDATYALLED